MRKKYRDSLLFAPCRDERAGMSRKNIFFSRSETADPAVTRSAEDEDKRRNPVKRVTSTRSEEALLETRRRARRRKYVREESYRGER